MDARLMGVGRKEDAGFRLFSPAYYAVCGVGGMLSAGTTHLVVTPLDVLKVNMQVNPVKYNSVFSSVRVLLHEQGPSALWRGWAGKLFGYGVQGGFKFGLYEYFKQVYSSKLDVGSRSVIYFISSASAQVVADVGLCPFEAIKVKVQTQPKFAKGLVDGFPRVYASEGLSGLYRGLYALWGRNLPFSMIMFSTYEHSVNFLYQNVVKKSKVECSKVQQLGVTCLAGYASGAIGTIVSNPADNIVASLYTKKAKSVLEVVKTIGLGGLFTRGLPIRLTIVGPIVAMQWLFYDAVKLLTGLPTSGGEDSHIDKLNVSIE